MNNNVPFDLKLKTGDDKCNFVFNINEKTHNYYLI